MNRFLCKQTLIIILIGMVVRYALGFTLTYTYDVHSWVLVISNFEAGLGLYDVAGYNYAPVWGYILGAFSAITEFFGLGFVGELVTEGLIMESSGWFLSAYAPSIPFIMAFTIMISLIDLATGYVIYRIVMERMDDHRKAVIGFSVWFLCPFVIAVGAVGGMFDALSALMVMISVYWVVHGKYLGAGVMLGTATIMKLFPGVIIPLLVVYIYHKHKGDGTALKNTCLAAAGFLMISLILLIPSIMDGHLMDCFGFITNRASSSMGLGLGALERYGTVLIYVVILILVLYLAYHHFRKGLEKEGLLMALLAVLGMLFLCPATPQYVLLITPVLIICALYNKALWKPYLVLCVGTTMFALSMNVANLLPLAAFTDLMGLETFETVFINVFMNGGLLPSILYYGGAVIQYIGTSLILVACLKIQREGKVSIHDENNVCS